jgi:hypothetical protein
MRQLEILLAALIVSTLAQGLVICPALSGVAEVRMRSGASFSLQHRLEPMSRSDEETAQTSAEADAAN